MTLRGSPAWPTECTLCYVMLNRLAEVDEMAGKGDTSFILQLMHGLVSDVDTAAVVLDHTSASLFRQVKSDDIESLLKSNLLEDQLGILLNCLRVLSDHNGRLMLHCDEGSSTDSADRIASISNVCTNLLKSFCCPVLDHVVASGASSDCCDKFVASTLSLLVPCFSFAACEARTKLSSVLINILSCKDTSAFHLPVVKTLSQLCECQDCRDFDWLSTDDMLTVIAELCLDAEEAFVGRILVQLVPRILRHHDCCEAVIARLWTAVERCYSNANDGHIPRCCFLICGLADVFYTPGYASTSFSTNLLSSSVLWNCVQKGLQHGEALTRKRAIFVLRRALDFASMIKSSAESSAVLPQSSDLLNSVNCLSQLSSVWQDVIILFETLEEKQVSVYILCYNADSVFNYVLS